jgi:hypothetical protein
MTVQELPRTDAARHSAGDADLTVMLATHDASAALTVREWRGVGRKSARKGGLAGGAETSPGSWTAQTPVKDRYPRPTPSLVRLLYRSVWRPRFEKTPAGKTRTLSRSRPRPFPCALA